MSDYEIGDERIMLYAGVFAGVEFSEEPWIDKGELVRCESCVNWGAMGDLYPPDYCPVVRKCTRPSDWCCWGAKKGESDGR